MATRTLRFPSARHLRPLYDAMGDMLDHEDVARLTENGVIEIAPLAYLRYKNSIANSDREETR